MGCGTSKTSAVDSIDPNNSNHNPDTPASRSHPIKNNIQNGTGAYGMGGANTGEPVPQPVSFEVPANDADAGDASIIKKHPPKRLLRLEDQVEAEQPINNLSHDVIDEKQAEAERRRLEILSQRVQSARASVRRLGSLQTSRPVTGETNGEEELAEQENAEAES